MTGEPDDRPGAVTPRERLLEAVLAWDDVYAEWNQAGRDVAFAQTDADALAAAGDELAAAAADLLERTQEI